ASLPLLHLQLKADVLLLVRALHYDEEERESHALKPHQVINMREVLRCHTSSRTRLIDESGYSQPDSVRLEPARSQKHRLIHRPWRVVPRILQVESRFEMARNQLGHLLRWS